jgi:hypothetical protein
VRSPLLLTLALGIFAALKATPAQGCVAGPRPIGLSDFRKADLVIVGRITRYEIIPDLYDLPKALWPEHRHASIDDGFLPEHARVNIQVDEVLLGSAPRRLRAT